MKGIRNVLLLAAFAQLLFTGCGTFRRPGVIEPPLAREITPSPTYTPTSLPTPTEVPTPVPTPTPLPVELPAKCVEIINNVKLTDLIKHRELFSIALQLEFKGRNNEAIAVLREAIKYRPNNELTRMKLAQLLRDAGVPEEPAQEATRVAPTAVTAEKKEEPLIEDAPPGLALHDDYLDIVNNARLSACARGFKLFVLASKLEREGKAREALFLYGKAVSLCPEEDGPNATINRQSKVKIGLLENRIKAEEARKAEEESGKKANN
ncbi:MAG: hypothetical protein P9M00_09265 [Candidatus Tritonobacter lacicola]|nr:hypothetical protein [Candidatus Tritonobacter lacicola]